MKLQLFKKFLRRRNSADPGSAILDSVNNSIVSALPAIGLFENSLDVVCVKTSTEETAAISFNEGYSLLRRGADSAAERSFSYAVTLLERWRASSDKNFSSHRFAEAAIQHGEKLLQFKRYDQATLAFEVAIEEIEIHCQAGGSVGATAQRARALCMLGLCYRMLLNFDDAAAVYLQAIEAWKIVAGLTTREDAQLRAMRSLAATMYSHSRLLKLQGERTEARAYHEEAQAIYGRLVKV